jgi:hypothetical protein
VRDDVEPENEIRYESRDVSPGLAAKFGVVLVLLSVITAVGALALFRLFASRDQGGAEVTTHLGKAPDGLGGAPAGPLPPAPRLQTTPLKDLRDLVEGQKAQLEGYAWVDQGEGTVRIPIERAMALVVERGLPFRGEEPDPSEEAEVGEEEP